MSQNAENATISKKAYYKKLKKKKKQSKVIRKTYLKDWQQETIPLNTTKNQKDMSYGKICVKSATKKIVCIVLINPRGPLKKGAFFIGACLRDWYAGELVG